MRRLPFAGHRNKVHLYGEDNASIERSIVIDGRGQYPQGADSRRLLISPSAKKINKELVPEKHSQEKILFVLPEAPQNSNQDKA